MLHSFSFDNSRVRRFRGWCWLSIQQFLFMPGDATSRASLKSKQKFKKTICLLQRLCTILIERSKQIFIMQTSWCWQSAFGLQMLMTPLWNVHKLSSIRSAAGVNICKHQKNSRLWCLSCKHLSAIVNVHSIAPPAIILFLQKEIQSDWHPCRTFCVSACTHQRVIDSSTWWVIHLNITSVTHILNIIAWSSFFFQSTADSMHKYGQIGDELSCAKANKDSTYERFNDPS